MARRRLVAHKVGHGLQLLSGSNSKTQDEVFLNTVCNCGIGAIKVSKSDIRAGKSYSCGRKNCPGEVAPALKAHRRYTNHV